MPFKLINVSRPGHGKARFKISVNHFLRIRVQGQPEILVIGIRRRIGKQPVVKANLGLYCMFATDPVNVAFYLLGRTAVRSAFAVREIIAMYGRDIAGIIHIVTGTFNDITVTKPDTIARE